MLAEGVEIEGQLLYLKENRCDFIQGDYFYRPMPASEVESILRGIHIVEAAEQSEGSAWSIEEKLSMSKRIFFWNQAKQQ